MRYTFIKPLFIISCLVLIFCNIFFNISYAKSEETAYVWSNQSEKLDAKPTNAGLSLSLDTVTDNPLNLDCGSACLIEQTTGLVMYDYNMHLIINIHLMLVPLLHRDNLEIF